MDTEGRGTPSMPKEEEQLLEEQAPGQVEEIEEDDNQSLNSMKAVVSRSSNKMEDESEDVIVKDPVLERYHGACKVGDLRTVREMVESKVIDLSKDYDENERISGLHWACINNRLSVVKYLASAGANVNFQGGDLDATPLHWASKSGLVYIVDALLQAGADPHITDSQGYNLLHTSVFSSNIMLVIYVLFFVVDGTDDVDQPDPHFRTALQWAAYQSDTLTVENLLKFNANVKKADETGFTALHWGTVKGNMYVMDLLIKYGSDFFQTTNDGKNCFTIGKELYSIKSLEDALYKNGFDKNGFPMKRYFTPTAGKLITFFLPYVLLPAVLFIFAHVTFVVALLINTVILTLCGFALTRFVIPSFLLSKRNSVMKSPLLSGILSGTFTLCLFVWIIKIAPLTFTEKPLTNLCMMVLMYVLSFTFGMLLRSNPGQIPATTDHDEIRKTIKELLSVGKFDTKHFCVHTWTRIPLRCKYDRDTSSLISRFDHFCPWVNNRIGLLNHKIFYMFVVLLEVSIWVLIPLIKEYFDELEDYLEDKKGKHFSKEKCRLLGDDDLCFGMKNDPFTFLTLCWITFQSVWVLFLIGVQTVQFLKGVTDYEFSQLNKKLRRHGAGSTAEEFFSSTPPELLSEELLAELDAPALDLRRVPQRTCFTLCSAVLGLDKAMIMFKSLLRLNRGEHSSMSSTGLQDSPLLIIPTDYGWKQNAKDFWLLCDTTLPLWRRILYPPKNSHALLNGKEVDYYTLYNLPDAMERVA